jgi:pantothenate kinase
MNLKIKTNREHEKLQERGTKRFQERKVEEKEAEQEIKEFDLDKNKEEYIDNLPPAFSELLR